MPLCLKQSGFGGESLLNRMGSLYDLPVGLPYHATVIHPSTELRTSTSGQSGLSVIEADTSKNSLSLS